MGELGIVVVKALCYKPEGRGFEIRWGEFSVYLILPAALGPEVYSASNRNKYQKERKIFLCSKARPVRKADNLTAIRADCLYNVGSLTSHNALGLQDLLRG
jgi:hypothetical protein